MSWKTHLQLKVNQAYVIKKNDEKPPNILIGEFKWSFDILQRLNLRLAKNLI